MYTLYTILYCTINYVYTICYTMLCMGNKVEIASTNVFSK